jgi:hypothetical protein
MARAHMNHLMCYREHSLAIKIKFSSEMVLANFHCAFSIAGSNKKIKLA